MNILITGGAGYIGSVVSEHLIIVGHHLFILDDLRDGNKSAVPAKAHFVQSDFGNEKTLFDLFSTKNIEVVIHLAALANVPDSVVNPIEYYENNISKTISLIKLMHQFEVKRIIFSSTAAVYGEPLYIPIDESHIKKPVNPYGFSKLMCEQVIKDCSEAYGIKYAFFRYFCAAGATGNNGESRIKESHIIPVILDQVLGRRKIVEVFGNDFETPDGSGVRDFIHVSDIANAHILAMNKIEEYPNQEFNLGNGKGFSVFELIRKTEELVNKGILYKIAARRAGDPAVLVASYKKANQILGWSPKNTIDDIILSAYNWRNNPKY